MCLIFFSLNEHPDYKLIIAANRDEFYNRATAPAQFWRDHPDVLAGRDMEAGGTWLGITKTGRISMLTNYRDPSNINPQAPSRGKLVIDYLIEPVSAPEYLNAIAGQGNTYNGFNLLAGTPDEMYYYSNYGADVKKLDRGFYGLSNHLLDTPWPKVVNGKLRIKPLVYAPKIDTEKIFSVLYNDEIAEDALLPQTGLPVDRERALSSMFIKTPNYGSRCSTLVMIDNHNRVFFAERTYDLKSFQYTTRSYEFPIQK
ncbi:MAG TPA: NRDE family protein [Ohtaekwangia sp.]|nr:NRDE family protein [Ohtaekwangia sp.]